MQQPNSISELGWIHRNRFRRSRSSAVSETVAHLARVLAKEDGGRLTTVAEILGEVVDADFREKCSLAALRDGTVHIEVAAPCWVCAMQGRWADALSRIFRERAPRLGIRRIRFEFGQRARSLADRAVAGAPRSFREQRPVPPGR